MNCLQLKRAPRHTMLPVAICVSKVLLTLYISIFSCSICKMGGFTSNIKTHSLLTLGGIYLVRVCICYLDFALQTGDCYCIRQVTTRRKT